MLRAEEAEAAAIRGLSHSQAIVWTDVGPNGREVG
jgi:hypothetical protein